MAVEITLKAIHRDIIGKKVRRLRQEGWVPGVAYGPDMEAVAIQIPQKELAEVYQQAGTSMLIGLLLEKQRKSRPALIREVQRDPISQEILHVDIELVNLKRLITTRVPIVLRGSSPVVEQGLAVLTHGVEEVEVRCLPTEVPPYIEVDLSAIRRRDQSIQVGDLTMPGDLHVLTDPGTVVVYTTTLRRAIAVEERPVEEIEAIEEEEVKGAPDAKEE